MATKEKRPERSYKTDELTRVVRWVSWVPVAFAAGLLVVSYPSLPDLVPTHFGLDGRPDAWGPKSDTVWLLAALTIPIVAIHVLSRYPRSFNYPTRVTDANAQRLYREGERMLVWLQFMVGWLLFSIILSFIDPAAGQVVMVIAIAGLLVALAVGMMRLVRAGRLPS